MPLGEYPQVHEYGTVEELQAKLRLQEGSETLNFVFYGERAFLSAAPFRFLLLPDGQQLPLFLLPSAVLPTELGFQGEIELDVAPAETEVEAAPAVAAEVEPGDDDSDLPADEYERDEESVSAEDWSGEPDDGQEE